MNKKDHNKKLIQLLLEVREMTTKEITIFVNKFNDLYKENMEEEKKMMEEKNEIC
jgi:hypothetical protein